MTLFTNERINDDIFQDSINNKHFIICSSIDIAPKSIDSPKLLENFNLNETRICNDEYEWLNFSYKEMKNQINKIKLNVKELSPENIIKDKNILSRVEECIKDELKYQNDIWTRTHRDLVEELNLIKQKISEREKIETKIDQIKAEIKLQKDKLVSTKLIYQSKIMEIPTSFLVAAKRKFDLDTSTQELGRFLEDKSREFLNNSYTAHQIRSETKIVNYKIVSDFIEEFQGGIAQSYADDPILYNESEWGIWYMQAYKLYPLFPTKTMMVESKNALDDDDLIEKLSEYIFQIDSTNLGILPKGLRLKMSDKISEYLDNINLNNKRNLMEIKNLENQYNPIVTDIEDKLLKLEEDLVLSKLERRGMLSEIELKDIEAKSSHNINKHISSRELIVLSNRREFSQSNINRREQLINITEDVYNNLLSRAKNLRSFKFFRVENRKLVESFAETYYMKVIPVNYLKPYYFTKREGEGMGYTLIGGLFALKVKLSHR